MILAFVVSVWVPVPANGQYAGVQRQGLLTRDKIAILVQ